MRLATLRPVLLCGALLAAGPVAAQPLAGAVRYVDADATGAADGTSRADAFPDLQAALDAAAAGDEVWVAEGTYRPAPTGDRAASFRLRDGVRVLGGFAGTEASRAERDWAAHPTTLSGDLRVPGDPADNSYHVVTFAPGAARVTVLR